MKRKSLFFLAGASLPFLSTLDHILVSFCRQEVQPSGMKKNRLARAHSWTQEGGDTFLLGIFRNTSENRGRDFRVFRNSSDRRASRSFCRRLRTRKHAHAIQTLRANGLPRIGFCRPERTESRILRRARKRRLSVDLGTK